MPDAPDGRARLHAFRHAGKGRLQRPGSGIVGAAHTPEVT